MCHAASWRLRLSHETIVQFVRTTMKTSSILAFALSVIILANTIQAQQQYGIILFYNGFGTQFCRPDNVAVVYSFPNMTCYATQDSSSYIVSTLDNTLTSLWQGACPGQRPPRHQS
eukprot:TRINITY_DN1754_c0_g1_i2.p1 TRINITY_DN1754_c0_g1~~TRINITY_DN1754_c0_g1_i2.p1  ORF type:complete len:116 (+),score=9.56 TRINITY_DN1754_c0_g1_i2:1-348(+)